MAASKRTATPLSLPPPSSKSILKTNPLKRESSDPVSPAKRRRVVFSDDSPVIHEIGSNVRPAVRTEVARTLERSVKGDKTEYQMLKRHFTTDQRRPMSRGQYDDLDDEDEHPLGHDDMSDYIHALASLATTLREKPYRDLVKVLLNCDWVGRDDKFVHGYIEFLASMASVGSYLSDCIGMIFDLFQDSWRGRWTVPGYPVISKEVADERLHKALKRLLEVSTATSKGICTFTKRTYPDREDSRRTHITYVSHLFRIREYHPDIGDQLLDVIMENLVQMDASMQSDLDTLDDNMLLVVHRALTEGTWLGLPDQEELGDGSDGDFDDDDDEDDEDDGLRRLKLIKNTIEVLDSMMNLLFTFYEPHFEEPDSVDAKKYFGILQFHFDTLLLRTRGSRHVQFLLFHFVQRSEVLTYQFIKRCEKHAFDKVPSAVRDYAAAYLASFVARGGHISANMVQYVFNRILARLEEYRVTHERACQGPNIEKYHSYYTLFQAAMYIFCFRWKDLLPSTPEDVDRDDAWSYLQQDLDWGENTRLVFNSNVTSKLNPLKVCSPAIVREFASLALKLNLVYVMTILELNKHVRLSQFVTSTYGTGGKLRDVAGDANNESLLQLDSYFPFDPYQLPDSKRWLEGDYLNWEPILGLHAHDNELDEDDDDDEVEEQDMVDDSIDESTATATDDEDDEE